MLKLHFDWHLIITSLMLTILGLTIMRSIVPELFSAQLVFVIVGLITFIIVSTVDPELLFSYGFVGFVLFLLLTLILPLIGIVSRGSTRWIPIGSFTIQPSELIKPFMLLTLAQISNNQIGKLNYLLFFVGFLPIVIVFLQPDLGTSLVLFIGWISYVLSKFRLKTLLIIFVLLSISILPIYNFLLHDYQKQRLATFINPYTDPLGQGYHIIQSTIAVGSGQIFGRGLGHGTQTQLRFLPEHHTDFIYSSISEELGFIGSFLTLLLYLILLYRIYKISQDQSDPRFSLFSLSVLGMLGFQIFVNIGMNIGIMPITGITLPLLSYGGSSLLSTAITLGIVNSISQKSRKQWTWEIK